MKTRFALMAAALFIAGPALAQAAAGQNPAQPNARQQSAAPAQAAQPPAANPAAAPGGPANAGDQPIDAEKRAAIVQLMQLTQESKLSDGVIQFITTRVRSTVSRSLQPDRLPKFMDGFSQKLAASNVPTSVSDAVVRIYARNFSTEDLRGLIQFYESPLGQRAMKALPDVQRQSEAAGLEIGRNAAIGVLNSMTDEYPEIKALLQPPASGTTGGAKPAATPAAPSPAPAPAAQAAPQNPPVQTPPAPAQAPQP